MSRFTIEEKISAVKRYLEGGMSCCRIAETMGIAESTFRSWCIKYESMGMEAFRKTKNNKYTLQFKLTAVQYYLEGKGSLASTCAKFKIRSKRQLRNWIKRYNDHSLKASQGGNVRMTMIKGRKTTLQERIDIVIDHIESGRSYAETAEKYQISYQQIYQWVQKYNEKGVDGLVDRRGRTKPEEEMSEVEKLQAENRMLKAKLKRQELENLFLKKLDEIERRRS